MRSRRGGVALPHSFHATTAKAQHEELLMLVGRLETALNV